MIIDDNEMEDVTSIIMADDGKGKAKFPEDGSYYEGEFQWDNKHGTGKYVNKEYVYHGFWKNDVKWGFGIE